MEMNKKDKAIEFMQKNEDLSPVQIDWLLEYMSDHDYLSEKGLELQNTFWKIFWRDNKFKHEEMNSENTDEMTREEIEDQNYEVLYETDEEFNKRHINMKTMKRIKVFGASEIMLGHEDGQVVMLTNTSHDHHENEEMFTLYNPKEIYEIYKLLKYADESGAFDAFEEDIFFENKD